MGIVPPMGLSSEALRAFHFVLEFFLCSRIMKPIEDHEIDCRDARSANAREFRG